MRIVPLLLLPLLIMRLMAGIPEVLAYQKISPPRHEVSSPGGWTTIYQGRLLFTDRYLVVYEPQVPDTKGQVRSWGYIEIFDRLTFEKLGTIHPKKIASNRRWGTSLAIGGNSLAVGSSGILETRGVDVYDLKTFRLRYHLPPSKGSSGTEYGRSLKIVGNHLVIRSADAVFVHDRATGKLIGKQSLASDHFEVFANSRFLMYSDQSDESGNAEATQVLDLLKPTKRLRIPGLSFLSPDFHLTVDCFDKRLFLVESKDRDVRIHGYDLMTRKRLFSLKDQEDDGHGAAAWKNRLFVPDKYSSSRGRVVARDLNTGKIIGIITPPARYKSEWFASRVACVGDILFISSDKAWYAYNPKTLKLLYRADAQGWYLSRAEPVPITGSSRIGFVFNFPNYDGLLLNSYHYNPQVMLLDVESGRFTHRLDLEDGIVISGFSAPDKFGRKLYTSGQGSIAVEKSGYEGDYKIFSLSPSAGRIQQKQGTSVSFTGTPGYRFEVRKTGAKDPIKTIPSGNGKTITVDIPQSDFTSGSAYELVRQQQFRTKDDYDVPWEDLTTLLGGKPGDVAVHGNLTVISVPEYNSPNSACGAVFVLDMAQRKIVRTIQPQNSGSNERFGTFMKLNGNRVVVISTAGTYVYDIETGTMLGKFPTASTAALSGNTLIRSYDTSTYSNSQWIPRGKVTAHDLLTGKSLYTVQTRETASYAPRIAVGADRMLLGLDVHDLATGQYLATLRSPQPETDDDFPSATAADGHIAAVAASGQGAVYLFDLTTGQHLRTCQIHDWPQGFINEYISGNGLSLDADAGILGWVIPDDTSANEAGVHLFDTLTGRQIAKIASPTYEVTEWQFPSGEETISFRNRYYLADAVALDGNHVVFLQGKIGGGKSLGTLDVSALRETPLVNETIPLQPVQYLEIRVESRRDTIYQIHAGPSVAQVSDTGISFQGTGGIVTHRVPIPAGSGKWVATLELKWANPEGIVRK